MSGSYTQKRINVTFRRGKGVPFAQSGTDTLTVSGLRVSASISKAGGISQGSLDLRIYGLTESVMNDLTLVSGAPVNVDVGNVVSVSAGDDTAGLALVYQGTISSAMANYSEMPNVPFHVTGIAALEESLMSTPPNSYRGGADAVVILSNLAKIMNMKFENSGVSGVILSNPYFSGSPYAQAEACAQHAGITMFVDHGDGAGQKTLAIWPAEGKRGGAVPIISPATGLVGYPIRTPIGVTFTTLFNPSITYGAAIELQTSVKQASGTWKVTLLDHNLESETPGGSWFSHVTCVPVGFT